MYNMELGDPNLNPIRLLGQGGFGRVYLCLFGSEDRRQFVCVKRIQVPNPKTEMKLIMHEIYIISHLNHPNIVKFIRSFVHAGAINIVMEYASNGTLRSLIQQSSNRRPIVPRQQFVSFIFEIILGLEYLHIRHIIHRDLKPENILLDGQYHVKIADFGISAVYAKNKIYSGAIGTYFYMAPEVMCGEKYDFKSDIWSLGCTIYEMCNGFSPFQQAKNLSDLKYLIKTLTRNGLTCKAIETYYGAEWSTICERMLTHDTSKRISLINILTFHPKITNAYYKKYFDYQY